MRERNEAAIYRLWLSGNLAPGKIYSLLEAGISAEEIWRMQESTVKKLPGLTEVDAGRLLLSRERWNPEERFLKLQEKGIFFVTTEEKEFPGSLREIHNPPYALYYRGNLPDQEIPSAAIVGSRARSAYGSEAATKISEALTSCGYQIISGLALGIDTDAHTGCLEKHGITYAVLGCGPDVVYPRQNGYLYNRILERGGIISEYPPGTPAVARQFPMRNRIISGLAQLVVVIEARQRSGSLITADYALDQGKEVYALPGRITDPLSRGTNNLIAQGANPIVSIEEFITSLYPGKGAEFTQLSFCEQLLSDAERKVYRLLDFSPMGLGELLDKSALELPELLEILEGLKQKGFAKEPVPNYFVKVM